MRCWRYGAATRTGARRNCGRCCTSGSPLGETRSYDDIARATRLHPRQIGWLVAANHLAILIPCHRVVGKDGSLVGYGGGLAKKRWLLDHELRTAGVVLR